MRNALIIALIILGVGLLFFLIPRVDQVEVARGHLIGSWRDMQNASHTRTFRTDGVVLDSYVGKADEKGNWVLFSKLAPPEGFSGEMEDGNTYLALTRSQTNPRYFKIIVIDANRLHIVEFGKQEVLAFVRL